MLKEKLTEKALDFIKDYVSMLRAFREPATAAFRETVDMLTEWSDIASAPNEQRRERLSEWAFDLHKNIGLDSPSTVSLIEKTLEQDSEGMATAVSLLMEAVKQVEPALPHILEMLGVLEIVEDDGTEPPS